MRQVRRLVAAAWLSLRTSSRGTTRVARWVVARIAGLAARQVPGVHRVLSHVADIDTASQPAAAHNRQRRDAADVGVGRTAIHLDLVTQYGASIPAIAQAVRYTVTKRIQDLTGLEITEVTSPSTTSPPHHDGADNSSRHSSAGGGPGRQSLHRQSMPVSKVASKRKACEEMRWRNSAQGPPSDTIITPAEGERMTSMTGQATMRLAPGL